MEFQTIIICFFAVVILYVIYHFLYEEEHQTEHFTTTEVRQYTDPEIGLLMKQWSDQASQSKADIDTMKQKYAVTYTGKDNETVVIDHIEKIDVSKDSGQFVNNIYDMASRQGMILYDNQILNKTSNDVKGSVANNYVDKGKMAESDKAKSDAQAKIQETSTT